MKINLVIFDCDGVLIDSEIICHKVNSEEMTSSGFPLSLERSIKLFAGTADEDFVKILQKEYNKTIEPHKLDKLLTKIRNTIKTETKPIPDILKIITYLDNHKIVKCIASNGALDCITNSLITTNLYNHFKSNHIFTASMVKNGKPMPDLFLYAAKKLNVEPKNCVVIEDSVIGIRAAKAAGMLVIGFLGGSHAQNSWYKDSIYEEQPYAIANNMAEVVNIMNLLKESSLI